MKFRGTLWVYLALNFRGALSGGLLFFGDVHHLFFVREIGKFHGISWNSQSAALKICPPFGLREVRDSGSLVRNWMASEQFGDFCTSVTHFRRCNARYLISRTS